jgi:uncharacterized protein (DUF302 family)
MEDGLNGLDSLNGETEQGIVRLASRYSVDATLAKLEEILAVRKVKLFAVVDHSGEAERAGLAMPPTKLAIFGNPQGGTPVMIASPSVALDLPLKILIAEDSAGAVWVSYNSVEYLQRRHELTEQMAGSLRVVEAIAKLVVE